MHVDSAVNQIYINWTIILLSNFQADAGFDGLNGLDQLHE